MRELRAGAGRRALLGAAVMLAATLVRAAEVEVLHYWWPDDSATASIKETLKKNGHQWKDFAIASGGANGRVISLLKARVASGNAPSAAMIRPPLAREWAREGRLMNLDKLAQAGDWDNQLPRMVREALKENGHYVALPVNIHRNNWLWVNNRLLRRVGARPPADWAGFFETAETLKRAGIVAVAHGGQRWQNLNLFESVALGAGGPEFYRKAFVERDAAELHGPAMEQVLRTFKRIKPYTQTRIAQRDWQEVSKSFINGEAAMQFIGDWAKPMFAAARSASGFDYACVPTPGATRAFLYVFDSFAMFKLADADQRRAQEAFAAALLSPEVQVRFNLEKGSIPVREGSSLARFDACSRQAAAEFRGAAEHNALAPAFPVAMSNAMETAVSEAISAYWDDDNMTPQAAMAALAAAMKTP